MGVIVDSSVWIDLMNGAVLDELETAITGGNIILAPLVIAELLSGDITPTQRAMLGELLQDHPLHRTPLAHWIDVGNLRRLLRTRGINVTIPDAHVAQCALDLDATLLARDEIFTHVAAHTPLRLGQVR